MPGDRPLPPPGLDRDGLGLDDGDLDDATAREIVAEAFHTFGEETARGLAAHLGVDYASCRDDIARLGRLHS